MPVTTTNLTANFTGDGVTTVFPFTFALQQGSDLQVFLAGVLQSAGTYTISINSNGVGGNVTFTTAPILSVAIFFERVVAVVQTVNFTNEGEIPSTTLTQVVDRLTMIDQQVALATSLSLSIPASQLGIVSLVLPIPIASNFLQWNNTGTALINATLSPTSTLGPGSTTTNAVALWNSSNGTLLGQVSGTGASGQVLTAPGAGGAPTWLNPTTGTTIPPGTIVMFYTTYGGTTAPSGWAVCDGTGGTPNLIGMLPMGTQFTAGVQSPNASGYGNNSPNAIVGATTHTHSLSVSGSGSGTTGQPSAVQNVQIANQAYPGSQLHTHTFSVSITSTGTSGTQNVNAPASMALVFLMKL